MGRSSPDDEVCRQTPRSDDPEINQTCGYQIIHET